MIDLFLSTWYDNGTWFEFLIIDNSFLAVCILIVVTISFILIGHHLSNFSLTDVLKSQHDKTVLICGLPDSGKSCLFYRLYVVIFYSIMFYIILFIYWILGLRIRSLNVSVH